MRGTFREKYLDGEYGTQDDITIEFLALCSIEEDSKERFRTCFQRWNTVDDFLKYLNNQLFKENPLFGWNQLITLNVVDTTTPQGIDRAISMGLLRDGNALPEIIFSPYLHESSNSVTCWILLWRVMPM